jgi:hypothetical protein
MADETPKSAEPPRQPPFALDVPGAGLDQGYFDINSPRRSGPGPLPPSRGGPTGPTGPSTTGAGFVGLNGPTGPSIGVLDSRPIVQPPTFPPEQFHLDETIGAVPPAVSAHTLLTGNPSLRSMTDGAVTQVSGTPLPLKMVDPAIFSNWSQPQPPLPQRSPNFAFGGPVEPPFPPLTRVVADSGGGLESTAAVGSTLFLNEERNLSLQPEHVASQARHLVEAIQSQIAAMPPTPNEPDKLEFQNGLIEFLEGLAAKLTELAETLDQMVANRGTASEPIFLGKAAIIANHLSIGAMDYIANHREKLAGTMIQGGLIGAATLLAMSLGIDKELLELIGKIFGKGK